MWCLGTSASLLMLTLMSHIFTESMIYEPFSTRTSPLGDPFEYGSLTFGIPDFNKNNVDTLAILPWSPNPNSTASITVQEFHQNSQPRDTEIRPSCAIDGEHKKPGKWLCEGEDILSHYGFRADGQLDDYDLLLNHRLEKYQPAYPQTSCKLTSILLEAPGADRLQVLSDEFNDHGLEYVPTQLRSEPQHLQGHLAGLLPAFQTLHGFTFNFMMLTLSVLILTGIFCEYLLHSFDISLTRFIYRILDYLFQHAVRITSLTKKKVIYWAKVWTVACARTYLPDTYHHPYITH